MFVGGKVQGDEGTRVHLGVAGSCDVGSTEGSFRGDPVRIYWP